MIFHSSVVKKRVLEFVWSVLPGGQTGSLGAMSLPLAGVVLLGMSIMSEVPSSSCRPEITTKTIIF